MSFVGTLIGAGFASGKEIATFLGNANGFTILLTALSIGLLSLPFTMLGALSHGNVIDAIFDKRREVGQIALRTINFIMLGAMLGGAESIIRLVANFSGGGFITAIFCIFAVRGGNKLLKALNLLLMPIILTTIAVIRYFSGSPIDGSFTLISPLLYVGMNALCAGLIVGNMSEGVTPKDSVVIGVFITLFMAVALLLIRSAIIGYENTELPIIEVSKEVGIKPLGGFIVYTSILTSALSSLKLCATDKGTFNGLITVALAYLFSLIGFEKIINYAYPFIGVFGWSVVILTIYRIYKLKFNKLGALPCNEHKTLV